MPTADALSDPPPVEAARDELQAAVPEAAKTLTTLLDADDERVQIRAAEAILDRAGLTEAATAVYYSAVHGLPSWLWTGGVVLGVVLSFLMWPAAVTGNETAISISLLGGGGLLFFVVLFDTLRLTDAHDELNFRWWFWSIPAFLPLIGWLFGLTWLWRRRSKVNAVS